MTSISTNGWKRVWATRSFPAAGGSTLQRLLGTNGFDTFTGSVEVGAYKLFVRCISEALAIDRDSSVLEIGCGCGAFLYELNSQTDCRVAGYDYSDGLIQVARDVVPQGRFETSEAIHNPFSERYSHCVSHDVFKYFPSADYAYQVIEVAYKSLQPGGRFMVMGLLDEAVKDSYHATRRAGFKSSQEYEHHYDGLEHLFFDRKETCRAFADAGFEAVSALDAASPVYRNSMFMFSVVATKPRE